MALTDVTHDAQDFAPPAEVEEAELYHPKTWLGKYVFSQDAKIIALQYSITAMAVGLLALVLSVLMRVQLAWPGAVSFITPDAYIQFVTMHGMIMVVYLLTALFLGGFGNYLIPLMLGARDMVFPYVNMISYWIYLVAVLILLASFFVPGGPTGSGWTLYPPQAILPGTPGSDWGITLMCISLGFFCYRIHYGWVELRSHGTAGPYTGYDIDAYAVDHLGHLYSYCFSTACFPSTAGECHYDEPG